jgi:hypothetical protein
MEKVQALESLTEEEREMILGTEGLHPKDENYAEEEEPDVIEQMQANEEEVEVEGEYEVDIEKSQAYTNNYIRAKAEARKAKAEARKAEAKAKKKKEARMAPMIEKISDEDGFDDAPPASTRAARQMREADDISLAEAMEGLGGDTEVEFRIYRTYPKKAKIDGILTDITGHLHTQVDLPTEDELKQMFGGGTYQVKAHRPNAKGTMTYFKAKSVKVSGPPSLDMYQTKSSEPAIAPISATSSGDSELASQAMNTMKQLIDDAKQNPQGGMDMTLINAMMAPLQAQVQAANAAMQAMQSQMQDKDTRMLELISAKPDTSEKDSLLNKMFDTEASRTEHLRQVHESEMRQLRDNAREDVKRAEDRHRDELRSREESHRREIDSLNRANDNILATTRMSYDAQIASLKSDMARVQADLTEARAEVGALRLKKDKSIIEQAQELNTMGEALKSLGLGGFREDEEDNRKWYEKLAGQVIENPEVIAQVAGAVTGQQPMQQPYAFPEQPPQQQLAPPTAPPVAPPEQQEQQALLDSLEPGVPFRIPGDEQVYVKLPDNSIVPYEQALEIAQKAESEAASREAAGVKQPSPEEVKMAAGFVESAFTAGTEAQTFATTAKVMIPNEILKYVKHVGSDKFLEEASAALDPGSPLRNQAGRNYLREVVGFLLG